MTQETGEILLGDQRIAYTVARSKRRRRTIAFVMESPSALKITAPVRASYSSIRSVIEKQTNWIKRRLREFQRAVDAAKSPSHEQSFHHGASLMYLGHAYKLVVTQDQSLPQGCQLYPHRLCVNVHTESLNAKNLQDEVRLEILLWLKKRAKVKLQKRMDVWASRLGVHYQKMVVANAERRWGSCNVQNVIRLNWRLIMAPLAILDYVVVHELCHVRHKNHGPRFWGQVASIMPDWKARRKHLRLIGGGLKL